MNTRLGGADASATTSCNAIWTSAVVPVGTTLTCSESSNWSIPVPLAWKGVAIRSVVLAAAPPMVVATCEIKPRMIWLFVAMALLDIWLKSSAPGPVAAGSPSVDSMLTRRFVKGVMLTVSMLADPLAGDQMLLKLAAVVVALINNGGVVPAGKGSE